MVFVCFLSLIPSSINSNELQSINTGKIRFFIPTFKLTRYLAIVGSVDCCLSKNMATDVQMAKQKC